jgi:hypothetical protein
MYIFLNGAFAAGFLVAAAFFLKFWRRTGQGLLLVFACAFALMGVNYGLLGLADIADEERSTLYLVRLLAFALIIGGVAWTNIRRT